MGFVLADQQSWLSPDPQPFTVIPLQTFEHLRAGVNSGEADFFMWEHFTSKKYYDNGSIKKIGEIYTPWPSWHIVARTGLSEEQERGLEEMFEKIDKGVRYFEGNKEESVRYISGKLDYSASDARAWLKTVRFSKGCKGVDPGVVGKTVEVLEKAGVLESGKGMKGKAMIKGERSEGPAS